MRSAHLALLKLSKMRERRVAAGERQKFSTGARKPAPQRREVQFGHHGHVVSDATPGGNLAATHDALCLLAAPLSMTHGL